MGHEKILRINELAKKKKEVGLTDEEAEERKTLHAQSIIYLFLHKKRRSFRFAKETPHLFNSASSLSSPAAYSCRRPVPRERA